MKEIERISIQLEYITASWISSTTNPWAQDRQDYITVPIETHSEWRTVR